MREHFYLQRELAEHKRAQGDFWFWARFFAQEFLGQAVRPGGYIFRDQGYRMSRRDMRVYWTSFQDPGQFKYLHFSMPQLMTFSISPTLYLGISSPKDSFNSVNVAMG